MNVVRILLADDHALVREGIKRLLDAESDMKVVSEAETGSEAVAKVAQDNPDIVLMDLSMPGGGGLEATRRIKAAHPETKIIALTAHEDRGYLQDFLEAGASGYVVKRAASEELIHAIRTVSAGTLYVDQRLVGNFINSMINSAGHYVASVRKLSERELAVLKLVASGYTNKEIASQLSVSVKTVETYKARSMEKLGLRSRVEIVRLATEQGWFRMNS